MGLELVRVMLRDGGARCRQEVECAFAVHVGWDQHPYVGSNRLCEEALARTRALGLLPERLTASPYDYGHGRGTARPATGRRRVLGRPALVGHLRTRRAPGGDLRRRRLHAGTASPPTRSTRYGPGPLPAPGWPCGRTCPPTSSWPTRSRVRKPRRSCPRTRTSVCPGSPPSCPTRTEWYAPAGGPIRRRGTGVGPSARLFGEVRKIRDFRITADSDRAWSTWERADDRWSDIRELFDRRLGMMLP
jgi:hypothetical protein